MGRETVQHTVAYATTKRCELLATTSSYGMLSTIPIAAIFLVCSVAALASDRGVIEELIVTAQRVEENLQQVPIAASAFNDTMIEDRQIVGLADLQLNVPNVGYADQTFGRGRFIIRGVGRQVTDRTAEDGVSVHLNGVPIPAEWRFDVLDLERLEVMRGPQGTLYGRNATGGSINIISKQPSTESTNGFLEIEYGDFEHRRLKGVLNLPLSDRVAVRVAAMGLKREGFTENLAAGQIESVDDDLDGRDLWSTRVTGKWWIKDNLSLTLLYSHFTEDDDRLRNHALVCRQNPLPTVGCILGETGFDTPHPHAFTEGFIAADLGARDPGARDASTGLSFDFPRPDADFRHQHTDFEPIYKRNQDFAAISLEWETERYTLAFAGGYFDGKLLSQQDDRLDVGYTFANTPAVPDGLWPTASQPFGIGGIYTSTQCNLNDGTAGVRGGCIWPADQTRQFSYDSIQEAIEQTALEIRLHSQWDGRLNFMGGANHLNRDRAADYLTINNVQSQLSLVGSPLAGFPWPFIPGFDSTGLKSYEFETYSAFGEIYWQATDSLKLTAGLRYNNDAQRIEERPQSFIQGVDITEGSAQPQFIRAELRRWFFEEAAPTSEQLALADFYDATEAILSATTEAQRLQAFQRVPVAWGINEERLLTGAPIRKTSEDFTARLGASWTPSPDHMIYAQYSRGYKPGSLGGETGGPGADEETVNTIEVGAKNKLANRLIVANVALFWNDYSDLQLDSVTPSVDDAVRNLNGEAWGAELEFLWQPEFLEGAQVHLAYSWLHTKMDSALGADQSDLLQGNQEYVLLRDDGRGLYVAPRTDVLPFVDLAVAVGLANPAPNTVYPDGIPALFSRALLDFFGVETSDGLLQDLGGNELPNAPEHSLNIGLSYSWFLNHGTVLARWDYYRQSASFARVNNTPGDRIDRWHQHNVSLAYEAANGRWSIKAWARNLTDEVNVNTSHTARNRLAGGRHYILNDPRLIGATLRVNFGL